MEWKHIREWEYGKKGSLTQLINEKNEEEREQEQDEKEREQEEEEGKSGELERESSRRRGIEIKNCHACLSYPVLPPRQVLGP